MTARFSAACLVMAACAATGVGVEVDCYGDALPEGVVLRLGTTRLRHAQGVDGVAFSPDGQLLATCGQDSSIRFWDVATGASAGQLDSDESDSTYGVAFSPDGSKIASASGSGFVRVWDVAERKQLWRKLGHVEEGLGVVINGAGGGAFGASVFGVAFSPDGTLVATGGSDPKIKVWDAHSGALVLELDTEHSDGSDARPVAFSPDGTLLASTSAAPKCRIHVWQVATGELAWKANDTHERDIGSLVFTVDGKELISAGARLLRTGPRRSRMVADIKSWNALTGEEGRPFATPTDLEGGATLAISSDGETLFSAHHEMIVVWNVAARFPTRYMRVKDAQLGGRTHGLAVSPDGSLLASRGHRNRLNKAWLWDVDERKELFAQEDAHGSSVLAVGYSPDGSRIVTGGADNTVRLWDAITGEHLRLVDTGTGWVRFVAFSPDGALILLGRETYESPDAGFQGEIKVYDAASGELVRKMAAPDRLICGALSADGKVVAAAIGIGGPIGRFGGNNPFNRGQQPRPTQVVAWDVATGEQVAAFDRGEAEAVSASLSSDGAEVTVVNRDRSVQRWNVREGKKVALGYAPPPPQNGRRISASKGVCSPDGLKAIFGGFNKPNTRNGTVSLVDLASGAVLWEKDFENTNPGELAASQDGELLAAYLSRGESVDAFAVLSMRDGDEWMRVELPDDEIRSLAFSPDGRRVVTGMERGDVLVWEVGSAGDGSR